MTKVHVTDTISAPADTVWQMLYDFGGLDKLLPDMIESCVVEGTGLGATRDVVLKDGGSAFETMSKLDEAGKCFDYTLDRSTLPLENYVATVKVTALDGGGCQIDWSSVFDGVGMTEEESVEFATGLYQTIINALKASLAARSAAAE
jgi:hypothetical protein